MHSQKVSHINSYSCLPMFQQARYHGSYEKCNSKKNTLPKTNPMQNILVRDRL